MSKKSAFFLVAALVLAGVYLTSSFTDWWKPKKIQPFCRIFRRGALGVASPPRIVFYLDKPCALSELRVVLTEEAHTNHYPHALWHLVTTGDAKELPVSTFDYGAVIAGMKPYVPGAVAEPLQAGESYSLELESVSKIKGSVVFHGPPAPGN